MQAAIVDTNVVVSGLITGDADAPPARILDGMLSGRFPFVVSKALLGEYRDVMNRPKLRKRHGLTPDDVELLLVALARNAIVLEPTAGPTAPEPGDQLLWDLLAGHDRLCLVTGDALLLRARGAPARVLSPAAFISSSGIFT